MLRPAQKQSAAEPESEAFLQPEPVREAAEMPSVQLRLPQQQRCGSGCLSFNWTAFSA